MDAALRSNVVWATQWAVRRIGCAQGREFIRQHHYAKGCSNTAVYVFGLFHNYVPDLLVGVTWWLPPTKVAAQSVNLERWQKVLALSRMAVIPGAAKNACTFMLARAVRSIRGDRRFETLLTYADESQGHTGGVYRAANWTYLGRTKPTVRWVDPKDGRQVAKKSTVSRTDAQMRQLGYVPTGAFAKHKFVLHLHARRGVPAA